MRRPGPPVLVVVLLAALVVLAVGVGVGRRGAAGFLDDALSR